MSGWMGEWVGVSACARVKFRRILLPCIEKKIDFSQFLHIYFLENNKL